MSKDKIVITLQETAGFCYGVERAIELAISNAPIYTYGELIHNKDVIKDLKKRKIDIVESLENVKSKNLDKILIRSHGIGRKEYEELEHLKIKIIDATCPFVIKIHNIVKEANKSIIILGDKDHPEVKGIIGWCKKKYYVISSGKEIYDLPKSEEYILVSQTTLNINIFNNIVDKIKKNGYNVTIYNTVCSATKIRQEDALSLSKKSDVIIIVGDKNSSNTRKLYYICKENCDNAYYVQNAKELKKEWFDNKQKVGITAGASTPKYIIEEVISNVRNFFWGDASTVS